MSIIEGLMVFFAIIAIYAFSVFILHKKGILEKYNISFWGPALMWRTNKGKKFLKKIAQKKRFWKAFGSSGIVLCFIVMIIMTLLVVFSAWASLGFTAEEKERLPGPEFIVAIPVINPMIPLDIFGYFIIAMVLAMVVHEFSHGILTYVSKLKVKSLGLLFLIFPIGAFCEPDEEGLKNTKRKNRMRIYAAGPTANFVVVAVTLLIFCLAFTAALQPASDGPIILSIDGGSPADEIGISQGMIISSYNDTMIANDVDLTKAILETKANQTINITYHQSDKCYDKKIKLKDIYVELEKKGYNVNTTYKGVGYSGINVLRVDFLPFIKNPLSSVEGFAVFWMLPLFGAMQGYNPIVYPFTQSYVITGPLSIIPDNIFWMIVNGLYWIFWLNFAVALFNVLPIVPLDGGFLFNDAMKAVSKRINKNATEEQQEKTVRNISLIISLTLVFLIVFPFIIKFIP